MQLFYVVLKDVASSVLIGSAALWTFASLLVGIFQCHVSRVWGILGDSCIDRRAFWTAVSVMNIVLDIVIFVIPLLYVRRLQVSFGRKATVVGFFSSRILYVETPPPSAFERQKKPTKKRPKILTMFS